MEETKKISLYLYRRSRMAQAGKGGGGQTDGQTEGHRDL